MQCAIGCQSSPAIGVATLRGRPDTPLIGCEGQYPLCEYHKSEIDNDNWTTIHLLAWEPLPPPE